MENTKVKTTKITHKTKPNYITTISENDLINILLKTRHTTFVGIDSETKPKMNKTGNRFYDKVYKYSTINALTAYQYENMVNNARKRQFSADLKETMIENGVPESTIKEFESDISTIVEEANQKFESNGLSWGKYMVDPITGIKNRVLINHTKKDKKTGNLLPETYRVYAQVAILHTKDPVYKWIETGEDLSEEEVNEMKQFFPKKKEGERQGLKKPYIIRSYALDNLMSIRINKNHYVVK